MPSEVPPGLTLERVELRLGRQRIRYYTVGRYCDERDQPCVRGLWKRYEREQRAS